MGVQVLPGTKFFMENDFLEKRAKEFLKDAEDAISGKRWNSAAFHLEQACQLYLKHYLYLKWKEFPKTHSLRELLKNIGKAYNKEKEVKQFIQKNDHIIADLEQAYITSRYLPVEFTQAQIKDMKKFWKDLFQFLKKL